MEIAELKQYTYMFVIYTDLYRFIQIYADLDRFISESWELINPYKSVKIKNPGGPAFVKLLRIIFFCGYVTAL